MSKPAKITHLSSRAVLRLSGPDRFAFLQGLVSQDVTLAVEGKPFFTAFLTPQGKYLYDFFVLPVGEALLLDVEGDGAADLLKRLTFFKMRSAVMLENVSATYTVFAAWGGAFNHAKAFIDPRLASLGTRMVVTKEEATHITTTHEETDYRKHRIKHGVAEGVHEIESGHATLLEVNFDKLNAISWNKGCYMGQELTARTHYRGLIKRRYLPFRFDGLAPEKHSDILDHGFAVGAVKAIESDVGIGLFTLDKIKPFIAKERILIHNGVTFDVFLPEFLDDSIFASAN